MMKFILGTKDGMTQIFDESGVCHAVTVLKVDAAKVTTLRAEDKDGYQAVQIASGAQKESRVAKATKTGLGGAFKHVKEFRPKVGRHEAMPELEKGSDLDASVFAVGDQVEVSAVSKGKGFQGVVKRHGFHGASSKSHGTKHTERAPGSIGAGGVQRVIKGMRMAGRMGGDRITVKNLTVLQVNPDENVLLIKGAIPGRKGTLVEVRSA